MKKKSCFIFGVFLTGTFIFTGCKDDGVNIFTVQQDIEFGEQMDSVIMHDDSYVVMDPVKYNTAYDHLNRIMNKILESDDFRYKNKFVWEVKIIYNDDVLNAFAVPGGYMYFYTGLIKYLNHESYFAGVMAHEMAHVDRRHATKQLTKFYGYALLVDLLLGDNPSKLAEIAADLAGGLGTLKFSRENEYEADEYAVTYLYDTEYDPRGIAGFFEQLEDENQRPKTPEFLSTHPSPDNRIEAINDVWKHLGSKDGKDEEYSGSYEEFKASLP